MKFYSSIGKRPVRLSEKTRTLAERALNGEFGKEMEQMDHVSVPKMDDANQTANTRYTECVMQIARQTPIRLVDDELIAGAATLNMVKTHCMPVRFENNEITSLPSVSHLTCGYDRVIKIGYTGLRKEIRQSMKVHKNDAVKMDFLKACETCLDAADLWHERYIQALREKIDRSDAAMAAHFQKILENLQNVPYNPPQNFKQAIQSLWFMFSFMRACGNWPAIGRIDQILYPYLKKDLETGCITLSEAREYMAHFWIKGCEWVTRKTNLGNREGSGDGQNYQNVVLSGMDQHRNDETNAVTYLVLEVVEELGISDFPIAVRLSSNSPQRLVSMVASVMRYGGGTVAVYNDDTVIPALVKFGYPLAEAVKYANDGCWEVQVPGKTSFCYLAIDMLAVLQNQVLHLGDPAESNLSYDSFEEVFDAFYLAMKGRIEEAVLPIAHCSWGAIPLFPVPLISLFVEGCIKSGLDYHSNGAVYNVCSPHAGGLSDVAGALQAIRYVVYDKKMMNLNSFMDIVKNNWKDNEVLRLALKNHLTYYGNGVSHGDAMMKRVYDAYVDQVDALRGSSAMLLPAGISTFGRQITGEFLEYRTANPDGHKKGAFLSHNINPTPGADREGATALLRSVCSLDLTRLPGGTALTLKLLPQVVSGEEGLNALTDYLYAFCELGGHFMQIDVVDNQVLRAAQLHPEEYENLVVRVSGWSARFNTLGKDWQDLILQSTEMRI